MHTILSHLSDLSDDPVTAAEEDGHDRCRHQRHMSGPSSLTDCPSDKNRCRARKPHHNCFSENNTPDEAVMSFGHARNRNGNNSSFDTRQDFLDIDIDRSSNSNDNWDPMNPYGLFNLPEPAGTLNSRGSRSWNNECQLQRERDGFGIFNLSQDQEDTHDETVASSLPPVELFEPPCPGPRSRPSTSSLGSSQLARSVCLRNLLEENDCVSRPYSFLHYPPKDPHPWTSASSRTVSRWGR